MNTARSLLYLLILFFPIQLGRHFFFDFSLIAGVRSSYIAPTIYLTDIISILLISTVFIHKLSPNSIGTNRHSGEPQRVRNRNNSLRDPGQARMTNAERNINVRLIIFVIAYLLFTSICIAQNQWAALYKTAKIIEWLLLGWAVITIRPRFSRVIFLLTAAGMYSAVIACAQFLLQRSVGNGLWWLGERTFYASTPAIATVSWEGAKLLRPYATFPHPNVLGGFLAVIVPWALYELIQQRKRMSPVMKGWYGAFLLLGGVALFLTFSRMAWIVAIVGALAVWERGTRPIISRIRSHLRIGHLTLLIVVAISAVLPLLWTVDSQSAQERTVLLQSAIQRFVTSPLLGVGLNNSLSTFYPFQPVHNVFLLILVETGVLGFCLVWWTWWNVFRRSLQNDTRLFVVLIQLFLLSLFDHYLITLQQGMLLTTLVLSLVFLPKNTVR